MKNGLWNWTATAGLLIAATAAAAATAAVASDELETGERTSLRLILDRDGAPDRLNVEDLGELEVGETRSFTTENGKSVVVTRDQEGLELDVDGKKIRVVDGTPGDGDVMTWREHRVAVDGEPGQTHQQVFVHSGAPGEPVKIVRRVGPGGAHGFAFGPDGALPPMPIEHLIERLERNAKFQGLDTATRALVLEALRESAPKPFLVELDGELPPDGARQRTLVLHLREDGEPAEE